MTDFDWEKAAGREHDRMVDELNDLREAKSRVEAENGRLRRALVKIQSHITFDVMDSFPICEIDAITRNTLAGERDALGGSSVSESLDQKKKDFWFKCQRWVQHDPDSCSQKGDD